LLETNPFALGYIASLSLRPAAAGSALPAVPASFFLRQVKGEQVLGNGSSGFLLVPIDRDLVSCIARIGIVVVIINGELFDGHDVVVHEGAGWVASAGRGSADFDVVAGELDVGEEPVFGFIVPLRGLFELFELALWNVALEDLSR
jgi:hypothetical protein